jgi:nucleoside-diphosphate-sugar epimerase
MIYLLGHRGFVGSAIASHLQKIGADYKGLDRANYSAFKGTSCDIFINAGGSSKKRLAAEDPAKDFELNVLSTIKTLADFRCKKYILISSIDVYNDVSNPAKNSEAEQVDPSRLSPYGFHKYLCELLVMRYCSDWLILRLGGMVGEGLKKNAIFDILTSGNLFVHPHSRYQYMNASDVANALWALKDSRNEVFNVCGKGAVVLEEVAARLGVSLDQRAYFNAEEVYDINIDKVLKLVPIRPSIDAVTGFAEKFRA